MTVADELFQVADRLESIGKSQQEKEFSNPLQLLQDAAELAGKAWSGSWLGYHSRVYYADFVPTPPGARFSKEWGLKNTLAIQDTVGEWVEYHFDDVLAVLRQSAGNPNVSSQEAQSSSAKNVFEECQSQILSLLSNVLSTHKDDKFLSDVVQKVENTQVLSRSDFISAMRPSGQFISRDTVAIQSGLQTPPHVQLLAQVLAIRNPFTVCEHLSKLSRRAASHIYNIEKHQVRAARIGTNVFIGHGRASAWRDLKDFIQDRIHLPWDEFNRVPVAGITNITRLSQMLDKAAIAFLVMTAEDEQADGNYRARQNVIHEAGLFQGRLGFEKAILLLEDGCEDFSNVEGLGQIRFPPGNISAVFEDIRRVLEREKLIDEQ